MDTSDGTLEQWGMGVNGVHRKLRVRSSYPPFGDLLSQRVDGKSNH